MNTRYAAIQSIAAVPSRFAHAEIGAFRAAQQAFGSCVFNDDVMRQRLPESVYLKVRRTIDLGERLDVSVAGTVAEAMRDRAIENGATRYPCLYPLTGLTAEKHDSF